MNEDDFFEEDAAIFAYAQVVGKLCEVGDNIKNDDFRNMVHDAALICLNRIVGRRQSADLHVFHGRKQ